jgi:hypothetical protein
MARFSLSLKARPNVTPVGSPIAQAVFTPAMGAADAGTQAGTVNTDVATVSTDGTTVATDIAAIKTSLNTLISTIGAGTGSAQAQALLTLVNTGSTDVVTLQADIAVAVTAAGSLNTAGNQDLVVSVNAANIPSVTALQRAFDACIGLAKGGVGGLTK